VVFLASVKRFSYFFPDKARMSQLRDRKPRFAPFLLRRNMSGIKQGSPRFIVPAQKISILG